ncbi:MAG TPA: hypothetical protein VM659_16855 [Dongiaceae bacterium]|nr:hypothetical protein [Dongiaceae bacterium]
MRNGVMGLIVSLGIIASCAIANQASATFISTDVEPSGELKFFTGTANKDVSSFTGTVGGQHSGPTVNVQTVGNVNTGAGLANIKPVKGSILTDVTFTPTNDTLFNSFFFGGQLVKDGNVTLKVSDSLGDPTQVFTFADLKSNAEFGPFGFVRDLAFPNDFETIKSIELLSDGFKSLKHLRFGSVSVAAVPLPASLYLFGAALLALGTGRAFSRRKTRLQMGNA